MRKIFIALGCAALLTGGLSGCTTIASGMANIAASLSSSTPSQVSTLADAVLAADTITKAADTYVTSGAKISPAVLHELQSLSNAVHTALTELEAANSAGKSLNYSTFNAALDAYEVYATSEAIPN